MPPTEAVHAAPNPSANRPRAPPRRRRGAVVTASDSYLRTLPVGAEQALVFADGYAECIRSQIRDLRDGIIGTDRERFLTTLMAILANAEQIRTYADRAMATAKQARKARSLTPVVTASVLGIG